MADSAVHDPRAASLALLDRLIRRGRELLEPGTAPLQGPPYDDSGSAGLSGPRSAEMRIWQYDCAAAINELSGGSKAHWLSRAYSNALLVRSTDGEAVVEADVADIVRRVLGVLDQGRRSVSGMDAAPSSSTEAQEPHRFDFVHDPQLRPVLEQAFADSRRAFEAGDYTQSLMTACGILEAIITDSLQVRLKADPTTDSAHPAVRGVRLQPDLLATLSFDERIAAAEAAGLIRGSCARLPAVARAYRDAEHPAAISKRDATMTRQVLRVVMRDLDPGR